MTASASSSDWLSLLGDSALAQLSGPAVFARGQTYASSSAIEELHTPTLEPGEQAALCAVVQGTQTYHVRVWIDTEDELDGECDCPHAQDGNFCKHLVALCLNWRGVLGGAAPAQDPQAVKKIAAVAKCARTQASNREALQRFVQGQNAAALAERLWAWAESDRNLMGDLKVWAAQHRAAGDPKALRSAITELLRNRRDYLDWRESGAYAHQAGKVLPLLRESLQRDPAQARELCEHALRCMYKVAENADDSDGEIGGLMEEVMDVLAAALRAEPPPGAWLDRWMALMQCDPWGLWSEASILAVAGPAVQARYAAKASADWQDWQRRHPSMAQPAKPGRADRSADYDHGRAQLRRRYLDSLRQQDEPRALLEAMVASAQMPYEFVELVELCEAQNWMREALQWARVGANNHPGDSRCEQALLRCYERDGWDDEALAIWRRRLEKDPEPATYQALLNAAERAGCDRAAYRGELFAWAEQRELVELDAERKRPVGYRSAEPVRVVRVRVAWYLAERNLEQALALVQQPGTRCDARLLEALALQLPPEQHAAAVQLLQRVFEPLMARASSPYTEPLALVKKILQRMESAQQAPWLATLREQYKPKRNFLAGLP